MLSLSLVAWNFYFQNCLSPFLAWVNGMATSSIIENKIPRPLKRRKPDPSLVHTEPFIGCVQLLFTKLFTTIFGLG